jgi:hypothetical protein
MSAQGVVNCLNCVAPAFPSLVIATGDATDAPWSNPIGPTRRSVAHGEATSSLQPRHS